MMKDKAFLKKGKKGTGYFLVPFPHPTFQTLPLLFSLARKCIKRAYRDPRTLVPLGTTAFETALGVGSRGIYFIFILFLCYNIPINKVQR